MSTLVGASTSRLVPTEIDTNPQHVLAAHRRVDGRCSGCGHIATKDQPLCSAATRALRIVADRGTRPTCVRALADHSDSELLSLADEHTGDHRCPRCGFVYSATVRFCPTYRRIRDVLESRRLVHVTPGSSPTRGLCAGKGAGWTVTGIDLASWRKAMDICSACPLLMKCREELNTQLDLGQLPREQILAAVLFSTTGRAVTRAELDDYAIRRGRTAASSRRPSSASRIREVAA